MSTITTPNMNLVLPVPTSELGPAWANELNVALGQTGAGVDGHDHSSGKGVPVTPAGINITSDLAFNQNNLTLVRSVRMYPNPSPLSNAGADQLCAYVSGVDLYYNDGTNQIRITQAGSVAGSSGTITGLPSGTASAAYSSGQGTFVFQQSSGVGANIDGGSYILRYPGSYPTPSGNCLVLKAPAGISGRNQIVFPLTPASTGPMLMANTGIISVTTYDAIGVGMTSTGANAIATSMTRSTGTSVSQGGVAISSSTGAYFNSTASQTTAATVTITTSGRPVMVMVVPDGNNSNASSVNVQNITGGAPYGAFQIRRNDGSGYNTIAQNVIFASIYGIAGPTEVSSPTTFSFIDTPSSGAHTYILTSTADTGSGSTVTIAYMKLVVYEL